MRLHNPIQILEPSNSEFRIPNSEFRTPRSGISLTEVLVAIFIMGIGCMAILTLFPLGALNMAQALKDDRCAQSAAQSDSYLRWYWKNYIVENPLDTAPTSAFAALTDPDGGGAIPAITGNEPSYPVCVDPMGYWARGGPGNINGTQIPRRNLSQLNNPSLALRTCSLLDGLTFDPQSSGAPINPNTGLVDREYRYNWLWFIQRLNNTDRTTATLTTVVFDKRAHMYVPPNAELSFNPVMNVPLGAYGAQVGSTTLNFASNSNGLGLLKGGWIMDATNNNGAPYIVRNCNWYRVVSVTQNPNTGFWDVELQTPLKPDTQPQGAAAIPGNWRTFVVMAGVSEVFERPNLTASDLRP